MSSYRHKKVSQHFADSQLVFSHPNKSLP